MSIGAIKKLSIFIVLGLLTISAFFIRLENFKNTKLQTIDEIVFTSMAIQVSRDVADYNAIPYGKDLQSLAWDHLPAYFFQPLFKHPPVFTFLLVLSMKLFGSNFVSVGYVPIVMGVMLIPLVYLLGEMIANRSMGLLAAIFMWIDPINIICSQKVWMDTTVTFFTIFTGYCFLRAIKENKNFWFILSAVAVGLAVCTKYTGLLIYFGILVYGFFYQRDLFRNRTFIFSLGIPFFMLTPWLMWNRSVYGFDVFIVQTRLHTGLMGLMKPFMHWGTSVPLVMIVVCLFILAKLNSGRDDGKDDDQEKGNDPILRFVGIAIIIIFFSLFLRGQLVHSLQINHIPSHSWRMGFFSNEPTTFYFGQLLEFSFIYLFAFISFFIYQPDEKKEVAFLRISSLIIIIFFIAWGSYQSRYVLPSIPFLLLLSTQMIQKIFLGLKKIPSFLPRSSLQFLFISLIAYVLVKTYHLNVIFSYTNDMCYF